MAQALARGKLGRNDARDSHRRGRSHADQKRRRSKLGERSNFGGGPTAVAHFRMADWQSRSAAGSRRRFQIDPGKAGGYPFKDPSWIFDGRSARIDLIPASKSRSADPGDGIPAIAGFKGMAG